MGCNGPLGAGPLLESSLLSVIPNTVNIQLFVLQR